MSDSPGKAEYKREGKGKLKIAAYTAMTLYTGAIAYMGYDIKRKINEISEKLDILEKKVEIMIERVDSIEEMVNEMYSITERSADAKVKPETKQIAGFEQDPREFAVLGMPEGSKIEGEYRKGGDYRVIKHVRSNKFPLHVPVIKGDVDCIRVRIGNGDFYGKPGKPVDIWLSDEETDIIMNGGRIPFRVSAL